MTQSEFLNNTNKNYIKCRLLPIMDPKGNQKCSTLSPRNASWAHPGQSFCSPLAIYNHLALTDYQKAVKMSLRVFKILSKKKKKSRHLNKVNQCRRRPLIPSKITESARKHIKPCPQISYKTLPLSRPSTMLVELGIDLQLRNWKPCATNGEHRLWNKANNIHT